MTLWLLEAWKRFPIIFQRQSLRSHGPTNRRFGSDLGKIQAGRSYQIRLICRAIFVIVLFALELMNAFPVGSLASGFGRAISWQGYGNISLKEASSTKMSVETQSISDALT